MDIISNDILLSIKDINFGCDWSEGTCSGMRKRDPKLKTIGLICCRGCAHMKGYLGVKNIEDMPQEYQDLFDPVKGFLGENGCVLPPEMKSTKCSIYVCRDANITDADRQTLLNIEANL